MLAENSVPAMMAASREAVPLMGAVVAWAAVTGVECACSISMSESVVRSLVRPSDVASAILSSSVWSRSW